MKLMGQKAAYIDTERYIYVQNINEDFRITLGMVPVVNDGQTRILYIWNSESEEVEPGVMCN